MADARFYYDLSSPYAWLAFERLDELLGPGVERVPILVGAVFKATGRTSWGLGDGRAEGMAEIERRARERGLPEIEWPDPWPGDGLGVMRAAVHAHEVGAGERFAREAFRVHFVDGLAWNDEASVALASERAGLDPEGVLAATADQGVKDRLRANTEEALARGVFGVPTVVVGEELFWGDDRLPQAARALGAT